MICLCDKCIFKGNCPLCLDNKKKCVYFKKSQEGVTGKLFYKQGRLRWSLEGKIDVRTDL